MNLLLNGYCLLSSYIRTYLGTLSLMMGMLVIVLALALEISTRVSTLHLLCENDPWNG